MSVKIEKGMTGGGIGMTSFMDIVFQLLIFFLVASKFEEAERDMKVVLPAASEAKPVTAKPKELTVNITREGTFIVRLKEIKAEQLQEVLNQAAANNPGQQSVIIRGDKGCELRWAVDVMNMCNKAKISDYRLAIEGQGDSS
ncbi:MAG: biopolymer transporter ExbD [Planctomycetes bacterium]|nr:biopolymer transporter ExbD [Planctomycetota bacterium]